MSLVPLLIFIAFAFNIQSLNQKHSDHAISSRKIVVRTFTGKGASDAITNWYYIKNIYNGKCNGYYVESGTPLNNFKDVNFVQYDNRPAEFEAQMASSEKICFVDPGNLPGIIQRHRGELETYTVNKF